MKILIDIDDKIYNGIQSGILYVPLYVSERDVLLELVSAITRGVVLSEGAEAVINNKVGQWVKTNINGQHQITCPCCDYTEPEYRSFIRNFCPNCGVYMVDSQESED